MTTHTAHRYSTLAILFHWTTAVLFLMAYVTVYYRRWFTTRGEPDNLTVIQIHTCVGVIIGTIAVLRLIWRRVSPPPELSGSAGIEHAAAKAMHYVLYFFMIFMSVTGYLGLRARVGWLPIPRFDETAFYRWFVTEGLGLTWEEWEAPIDWAHLTAGAFIVWVLIAIHVTAALYHHFIRQDDVLSKMLPWLRSTRSDRSDG